MMADSYWTYVNNCITMKIRILNKNFWILEGSVKEKQREMFHFCLQKYNLLNFYEW